MHGPVPQAGGAAGAVRPDAAAALVAGPGPAADVWEQAPAAAALLRRRHGVPARRRARVQLAQGAEAGRRSGSLVDRPLAQRRAPPAGRSRGTGAEAPTFINNYTVYYTY